MRLVLAMYNSNPNPNPNPNPHPGARLGACPQWPCVAGEAIVRGRRLAGEPTTNPKLTLTLTLTLGLSLSLSL